jgi:transcriptional regulator with XRE-family HTH domain
MKAPELLRAWREERGFSQTEAAEFLDVSQSSLSDYEAGRAMPRADVAVRIQGKTKGKVPVSAWASAA